MDHNRNVGYLHQGGFETLLLVACFGLFSQPLYGFQQNLVGGWGVSQQDFLLNFGADLDIVKNLI